MEHIEVFLKGITFAILITCFLHYNRIGEKVHMIISKIMLLWIVVICSSLIKQIPQYDTFGLPEHTFPIVDLLLLPTFAFVTTALTNVKSINFVTLLVHEVPFLIISLIYIFTGIELCYIIGVIYGIVYSLAICIYASITITKYNKQIRGFYSDDDYRKLDWLRNLYWILLVFILVCGTCVFIDKSLFTIAACVVSIIFWFFLDYNLTKQSFTSLQTIIENKAEEDKKNKEQEFASNVMTFQKSVDQLQQMVNPYDYDGRKKEKEQNTNTSTNASHVTDNDSKKITDKVDKKIEVSINQVETTNQISEAINQIPETTNQTEDSSSVEGQDINVSENPTDVNINIPLPEHIEELEVKNISEDQLSKIMDRLDEQIIEEPKTKASSEQKDVIDLDSQNNQYAFVEELNRLCREERIFLTPGLSIQDVVDKLGTNRTYLSNYLNKELRLSFYEFINEQRLDYAAMLLASTKINIEQIIFECGFQSKTTFHRVFAQKFGCTPKQYRDRQ